MLANTVIFSEKHVKMQKIIKFKYSWAQSSGELISKDIIEFHLLKLFDINLECLLLHK